MIMATPATTVRYASRSAVHGSNAYDLSRSRASSAAPAEFERTPARRPEIRPGVTPAPKTAPRQAPVKTPTSAPKTTQKPATRTSQKRQKAYGISLYAALGFVVVAVLMVFVLLSHVRFTEVTNETAKLQSQLTKLNEQERKLKISYENAFDVNQVEQYATHQLGMSKPAESQIVTISAAAQDRAVVSDRHDTAAAAESMGTFLASLVAYFK
jgi:cell division protein FtsL